MTSVHVLLQNLYYAVVCTDVVSFIAWFFYAPLARALKLYSIIRFQQRRSRNIINYRKWIIRKCVLEHRIKRTAPSVCYVVQQTLVCRSVHVTHLPELPPGSETDHNQVIIM